MQGGLVGASYRHLQHHRADGDWPVLRSIFSSLEMFGVFWGEKVCEDDILSIKKSYLL